MDRVEVELVRPAPPQTPEEAAARAQQQAAIIEGLAEILAAALVRSLRAEWAAKAQPADRAVEEAADRAPAVGAKATHKPAGAVLGAPAGVLSEADAARYLGLSRAFLKKRRRQGKAPAFLRIGRTIRYAVTDLDALLLDARLDPWRERRRG